MWNASAITWAMSSPLRTRKLCLVIGMVMPEMSASWKASVPMSAAADLPVMATTGIESICASASGVTRLVAPGPDVAMHHPDLAGRVGVPAGGVAGALFVADQHVAQLLRVEERVVHRQDRAAGDAEDHVDVEFLERSDHRLRTGELVRRNRSRLGRCRCSPQPRACHCAAVRGFRWSRGGCAHGVLFSLFVVRSVMLGDRCWGNKKPPSAVRCTRVARRCS